MEAGEAADRATATRSGLAACLALLLQALTVPVHCEEVPLLFSDFLAMQPVELIEEESLGDGSYLLPLGAMQKLRGNWRPEHSERLRGSGNRFTFRLEEGFASSEVVDELDDLLAAREAAELLYSCDARACGNSSQWASRIFEEELLYGRAETQRYRAWRLQLAAAEYRVVVYASARSTDRQYLRLELLRLQP